MSARELFEKQFISTRLVAFVVGIGITAWLGLVHRLDPNGVKSVLEALIYGFFGTKVVEGVSYVAKNWKKGGMANLLKGGNQNGSTEEEEHVEP